MIRCWWKFVKILNVYGEGLTARDIVRATGLGQRRVYRWLKAGEEVSIIERLPTSPRTYRLQPRPSRRRKVR